MNREDIETYINRSLNHYENMAKKSCESRGLPYYYGLRHKYPTHSSSFAGIHNRHITKNIYVSDRYRRDLEGFINFLVDIGDVPKNMAEPTVGRYDHDKGYIKGNFRWQELRENSKEVSERNGMTKKDKLIKYLDSLKSIEDYNFDNAKKASEFKCYRTVNKIKREYYGNSSK